jgi:hypothetical protein
LPIARAKPALTGAVKPRRNTLSQPRRLAWPQQTARKCPRRGRAAPGVLRAGGAAGSEHEADGVAQSYKNITIKNARGKPGPDEKRDPRQPSWLGQRVAARLHRAGERGLRPRDWQRERCERLLSTVLYHLRARAQGAKVRRMTEPSLRPRRSSIGGVYL